jgi:hypothetical protein
MVQYRAERTEKAERTLTMRAENWTQKRAQEAEGLAWENLPPLPPSFDFSSAYPKLLADPK